ncbi:MBOAT, membrane-bound O-acyltransferase family-domain-containing protein [Pisolithus croceorrhizus]|nr:MBOAT, membrane-bound O-acyltransferase family-domain-containing protein [Pisolithus croceorrhizus]KAI6112195.1 MBOAT, membrane-bound O-acyltransferase family-domain-containing protein [Pisolithus croceorrhizus]
MPDDVVIDMSTDSPSSKVAVHRSIEPVEMGPLDAARGIASLTVGIPSSKKYRQPDGSSPPPRWKTPEFIFYYIVFVVVVPFMAWVPIRLSSPTNANYPLFRHQLKPGWLFGRDVDNSDRQYRAFRDNIPALSLLALIYLTLQWIYTRSAIGSMSAIPKDNVHLVPYLIFFATLYLVGLHGTSTIKILTILTINYYIGKGLQGSRIGPLLTWIFNAFILFVNERNEGYHFSSLHPSLAALDVFEGLYPRWHISFNITMLRLVSFNMDYYWACNSLSTEDRDMRATQKERINTPHPLEFYTYANYLAYALFPPLYIAGPILTYNDFLWQLRRPQEISLSSVMKYFIRFLICLITMEFILHTMYVVAIKDTRAWVGDTSLELSMIGFWNLIIVWLKLLLPWRFFRLWSLASGIDPPENMVRCMANNYSTTGFWRSWHRSYNLWIVRYIYIPLGGTKNVAVATLLIFTFVALWHDLSFRLLAWGWLVCLFIVPELLAAYLLPQSKYGRYWWYRHVCAIGAVFNILMMMTANLVGFVIGIEGVLYLSGQITGSLEGFRFIVTGCCCLFAGVQLMFEYREEEKRMGIFLRC